MDAERVRRFVLALPHVVETMQWGDNLVFWVGDKAIGGKMFALMNLDARGGLVMSFAAGAECAAALCEMEGLRPAPYFARLHWIAAERWDVLTAAQWKDVLGNAHSVVHAKLPRRTLETLALPARQQAALIAERRKLLAAAAALKKPKRTATVRLRSRVDD